MGIGCSSVDEQRPEQEGSSSAQSSAGETSGPSGATGAEAESTGRGTQGDGGTTSGADESGATTSDGSTGSTAEVWTQGCLPSLEAASQAQSQGQIGWDSLQNPILQFDDHAVKDMSVRWVDGEWKMMFSYIAEDPFRFRVGRVSGVDWSTWSDVETWDKDDAGGLASADITALPDGTHVAVFNSHTYDQESPPVANKLYYRTSMDFETWSPITRLVADLWDGDGDRLIDAALAHADIGVVAAFKFRQTFRMAYSPSGSLDGPWTPMGDPDIPGGLENYQFLQIDGTWHLLGTTLDPAEGFDLEHMPALYRIGGDPSNPQSWLSWELVGILAPPIEAWNGGDSTNEDYERANAAFLCDAREVDGFFYLFYAGSNETDRFEGRGHAKIGVARSSDLTTWDVP